MQVGQLEQLPGKPCQAFSGGLAALARAGGGQAPGAARISAFRARCTGHGLGIPNARQLLLGMAWQRILQALMVCCN